MEKKRNDKLLKLYLGDDYDKFIKKDFSIDILIFGPIYVIYRKWISVGIGWFLLDILSYLLLPNIVYFILMLSINIIMSFKFNKLYIKHIEKVISKYSKDYRGKNLDDKIQKAGKKSKIFFIFAIILAYFTYQIIAVLSFANSNTSDDTTIIDLLTKKDKLEGISYKLPKTLTNRTTYYDGEKVYTLENGENYNYCYITMKAIKNTYKQDELINCYEKVIRDNSRKLNDNEVTSLAQNLNNTTRSINNKSWHNYDITSASYYFYVPEDKSLPIYSIVTKQDTNDLEACKDVVDEIINSMKFKNKK